MFMEASAPRRPGDVAELINDQVKLTTDSCLSFWYHMYGKDIGTLAVYGKTGSTPKLLWAQSGDKKSNWLNARVGVTKISI